LIYRFKNAAGVVKAYAVWCPTSNQTTVNNYQLTLQGTPTSAAVVNLQVNDPDGVRTPLTINAGKVVVNVSERPIFVLIDNNDPDFVMSTKLNLDNAIVTNESGLGNADLIIDERNTTAGDPREQGGAGAPTTIWAPGNVTASAYINLMQSRFIDRIFIRDMSAVGNLTIEVGSPGNWTPLVVDPLDKYQAWNMHVVNTTTQYIRFTRANGNSNFSEVVLYGK
jgi:hypothetical protein